MKKFFALTILFFSVCALGSSTISKIIILGLKDREIHIVVFGRDINSLLILYNNENIRNACTITPAGTTLDGIIAKWNLSCKLPKSSGEFEIKYIDVNGKNGSIFKFIE